MTYKETLPLKQPGNASQFLAWHREIPYLATFTPNGAGFFDLFEFTVADPDFRNSIADVKRRIQADPQDVIAAGSAQSYLETLLANAA